MAASRELADRAAAVCRRPLSAKALREELVALVRRAVPFGGYNFPLTDPASRVATSPLADVPGLSWARLPTLEQIMNSPQARTQLVRHSVPQLYAVVTDGVPSAAG